MEIYLKGNKSIVLSQSWWSFVFLGNQVNRFSLISGLFSCSMPGGWISHQKNRYTSSLLGAKKRFWSTERSTAETIAVPSRGEEISRHVPKLSLGIPFGILFNISNEHPPPPSLFLWESLAGFYDDSFLETRILLTVFVDGRKSTKTANVFIKERLLLFSAKLNSQICQRANIEVLFPAQSKIFRKKENFKVSKDKIMGCFSFIIG